MIRLNDNQLQEQGTNPDRLHPWPPLPQQECRPNGACSSLSRLHVDTKRQQFTEKQALNVHYQGVKTRLDAAASVATRSTIIAVTDTAAQNNTLDFFTRFACVRCHLYRTIKS